MKTNNKKNKGGRPVLKDDERKDALIKIYCQISEKERVTKEAKSAGLTVSDYTKRRLFGETIVLNYREIFSELHLIGTEISRAGNNINQLAKHANSLNKIGKLDSSMAEKLSLMLEDYVQKKESLRVALRKIIRELGK